MSKRSKAAPTPPLTNYIEEGNASWYGEPFHGRRASNGEIYDMYKLTAAHRTLPFETMVRVTNLSNGKFQEVTKEAMNLPPQAARGGAFADDKNDGGLGNAVSRMDAKPLLLENTGARGNWLALCVHDTNLGAHQDVIDAKEGYAEAEREMPVGVSVTRPCAGKGIPQSGL